MKIINHRLLNDDGTACRYQPSPSVGGVLAAQYLVMHFTAGRDAASSIASLCNKASKASAHVVIGRDGGVTQLVPFNRVAWHAGVSRWQGLEGMNRYALGIELDNAGRLDRVGSRWQAWFKASYPDDEVLVANHKNDAPGTPPCGWHTYTEVQIAAALEVATLLVGKYALRDVLGHEDIAPGRKVDPGPDFPMTSFRARLFGRAQDTEEVLTTTTALHIRVGAGAGFAALPVSPLPLGTRVEALQKQGNWWRVAVLDTVAGDMDVEGWVNSRFLRAAT
ncbi:N-acetylmuramoyl-L-alanine amidase [Sulfuriferula multivorans]|uniref:N-acetylmuramoyl-L-alanine amidase n=1 Tax=Sulfuriferula multivorans TaxID=1559896 RepID=A0A401JAV5_9PROT|nr:N-acetylmuramoyl-L-alanine amidase [Sulfuriferula multivorans]GBL44749.1 N-acetylmuramoyl-L-alanine amidase [Sulfuriferula multivorans]